jgi:hypothetical protein
MSKTYSSKKLISRNNEQPITLKTTTQEYKGKIYVKTINLKYEKGSRGFGV